MNGEKIRREKILFEFAIDTVNISNIDREEKNNQRASISHDWISFKYIISDINF